MSNIPALLSELFYDAIRWARENPEASYAQEQDGLRQVLAQDYMQQHAADLSVDTGVKPRPVAKATDQEFRQPGKGCSFSGLLGSNWYDCYKHPVYLPILKVPKLTDAQVEALRGTSQRAVILHDEYKSASSVYDLRIAEELNAIREARSLQIFPSGYNLFLCKQEENIDLSQVQNISSAKPVTDPLWSCSSYDCPTAAPKASPTAPTCYTCGCKMEPSQ